VEQAREARQRLALDEARKLFEEAAREEPCRVVAGAGLAEIFNRKNEPKRAIAAARAALVDAPHDAVSAEASFQLGQALIGGAGSRKDRTGDGETALIDAIAWSEGGHRAAIRELALLYAENGRVDDLAKLAEEHPAARVRTRGQRLTEAAAAATAPKTAAEATLGADAAELAALPRFEIWDGKRWFKEAAGYLPPLPLETATIADVAPPDFTSSASGEVVVGARLGQDGSLSAARVLTSLDPQVDALALEALSRWRLEPAKDATGDAIDCVILLVLHFKSDP
jgi:TonB family protein